MIILLLKVSVKEPSNIHSESLLKSLVKVNTLTKQGKEFFGTTLIRKSYKGLCTNVSYDILQKRP